MTPAQKLAAIAGRVPARCVWTGIPSSTSAEIVGLSGADLAVIDTEHGAIPAHGVGDLMRAFAVGGTRALVRVADNSPASVKQVLDAGADGIIVPYVRTIAEAEAAVRHALYPPRGIRGQAAGVIRATGYGKDGAYVSGWNARAFVAIQIETQDALDGVEALAAVEGVDMLFFGPYDYAQDAGLNAAGDAAAIGEAFGKIVAAARHADKLTGVFPWPGVSAQALAAAGADLIAVASDVAALTAALRDAIQASSLSSSDVS